LVESLVLGDRGDVARSLDDAFRVAGVSHVLSVSGLHLAIAAFLLFVGLRWLLAWLEPLARRVAVRRIAALCALPATALYTLLTGAAVATVRSCVVAWIWLGAIVAGRAPDPVAALAGAALAILAWSPLSLWDPSFQLSFAAALGMALAPKWRAALRLPSPTGKSLFRRLIRWAVGLVYASAAAIVATAPIAAWHFGQVAPVGLVSNLAVVPLAELWVLPIGLFACAVSAISPWLANPLFDLAGLGAAGMARLVRWIASWAPEGRVPSPTLVEALLWYAALVALALPIRRARKLAAGFLLLFGAALATRAIAPRVSPSLTVTFLDVGQGDSCLVELPGATLLVDGGGSFDPRFDPGEELIAPWLARHGVRRLDAVVLTHPHPDHANGLAAIVERFPVGEVWTNGAISSLPGLVRLERAAAERKVPVVRPHSIVVGEGAIEVLHPLEGGEVKVDPRWSENDGSIVLRVRYRDRAVLLAGDIEARAEEKLVAEGVPLAADVLKAPHHGSPTSSTPEFVAAVHPKWVVFSVGEDNRWHFPGEAVQKRWREMGSELLRTDWDGAITVKIDRAGEISVEKARKR
jgi:competence protein ComEC